LKTIDELKNSPRLQISSIGSDGLIGWIIHPVIKRDLVVVASWGGGWEHVSVSFSHRCPTWDEMCIVKDLFWNEDECVVQYHPPKTEYVNNHPHCLHLWKKIGSDFETPPKRFV